MTGAAGWVGLTLCRQLVARGYSVRALSRRPVLLDGIDAAALDLDSAESLRRGVSGADVVYHLAAHVHVRRSSSDYDEAAFQRVNVDGTLRLAEAAANAGVRRFVFASTIGVHGDETSGTPVRESDPFRPFNAYTASKLQAEERLRERFSDRPLAVSFVRAPLVYGPGARGSFLDLLRLVSRHTPLPFAGVSNCRTLVSVENLADALIAVAESDAATGEAFVVGDFDVSTPDLIRAVASAFGIRPTLFRVPQALLDRLSRYGPGARLRPLIRSLAVDSSKIRRMTGWVPRREPPEEIAAAAQWFREGRR